MNNVIVIGSQWGDEGKGKIVDWLSEKADVIIRFQGGHNAGHTLVVDNITYKLKLLPSGIVRKNKISIIGNGVVIDPWALLEEIDYIKKMGVNITKKNLYIAENATLILPFHKELDGFREDSKNTEKIGTTRRGIGPAYEDKVGRRGIRVMDLSNKESLSKRIDMILSHHDSLRKGLKKNKINKKKLINDLIKISPKILKYSQPVWKKINEFKEKKKTLLFEGAQGALLDIDHGTYPFVTSSNTVAGAASAGTGCAISTINYILGIVKTYTTRVGEGPFPTELKNEIGKILGKRGKEFGTVTNRKRRCGWFDAVLVKQSCIISGINAIALTKIDVLDKFKDLYVCTGYKLNGKKIDYFPSALKDQLKVKPIYKKFKGWLRSTKGIKKWKDLPKNTKKYINFIKRYCGVNISSVSTSPRREDTILLENPFKK
jgi:adenylosuccinate synthase